MQKSLRAIALFCLLILTSNVAHAGKIKKAFEALSVYNYFKAKELFEKKWKNNKVSASYGLSLIYGKKDNPFYNLDSAYMYITLAASNYSELKEKKKIKIKSFDVDSLSIENWKDSIDLKSFQLASKVNRVEEFERYMLAHFDSDFRKRAEYMRDSIVFNDAQAKNSSKAILHFIEGYPNSNFKTEALNNYHNQLFTEITAMDDLMAYRNFVKKYSNHPKLKAVEDSIYAKSIIHKNYIEYKDFIKLNPSNSNVGKAWRSLYKLYTSNYSYDKIKEFQNQYPNYPFQDELQRDLELANELYLPFKVEGFWGFMNNVGSIKIPAKYSFAEPFSDGLALVGLDDKVGFINKQGVVEIPFDFEEGYSFKNGLAVVGKNQKFGIINRVNKQVVPFKYEFIEAFHSNIALAALESGYGYLNTEGKELMPFEFSYASDFESGFATITKDKKMALLNKSLQIVIPFNYSILSLPLDSVLIAKNDSLFGIISLKGDTIMNFEYQRIDEFAEGMALIQKEDKYGYANQKGEIVIPTIYEYNSQSSILGKFEKGYAKFLRKGKIGVIDKSGKEVAPAIFDNLKAFSLNSLFPVKKKDKWGFANGELQLKIKYKYTVAEPFQLGLAIVQNDSAFGVIDESDHWVILPEFNSIKRVSDSIFIVGMDKFGMLNSKQEIIVPLIYDEIRVINEELVQLFKEEDLYYYLLNEKRILNPKLH